MYTLYSVHVMYSTTIALRESRIALHFFDRCIQDMYSTCTFTYKYRETAPPHFLCDRLLPNSVVQHNVLS